MPNNSFLSVNMLILKVADISYSIFQDKIILDFNDNPHYQDRLGDWQQFLKRAALYNQGWKCGCGKNLSYNGELHHALIQRSETKNPSFLHHSFNVIVLSTSCHRIWQNDRNRGYEYLHYLYGDRLNNWLKETNLWKNM